MAFHDYCVYIFAARRHADSTDFIQSPAYGEKHKTPEVYTEVMLLSKALMDEKIQSLVELRPANDHILPFRELIKEGTLYTNTRKAFWHFTLDTCKAEKCGFTTAEPREAEADKEDGEGQEEDYLRADDEEFFYMAEPAELFAHAMESVVRVS